MRCTLHSKLHTYPLMAAICCRIHFTAMQMLCTLILPRIWTLMSCENRQAMLFPFHHRT